MRFVDTLCGKAPKDPERLRQAVMRRAKEFGIPAEEAEAMAAEEAAEVGAEAGAPEMTFHRDDKGLFVKTFDIG